MLVEVRKFHGRNSRVERCRGEYDAVDVRVEVCDHRALAIWDGDVLLACAFDDGKRYVFLRHYAVGE